MDCCHNCFACFGFSPPCVGAHAHCLGCVSPSTSSWVANLAVYSGVGAWRMPSASSVNWHSFFDEDSVTRSVVLQNYKEDDTMFGDTLENLGRSPSAEKHWRSVLAMEAREGPNDQNKTVRLRSATGRLFEDVMATYHQPGIAGEACGKSSQHPVDLPTALEEIWCVTSPARPQQCVHDGRRSRRTLASSVLRYHRFRVPAPDRRPE